jgi:hypothetical protein
MPGAHTCNPSYPGDRDPGGSRLEASPRQLIPRDPISKIPNIKMDCGIAQGIAPECMPQYCKKKKKVERNL